MDVSIIIVNYNGGATLARCLESLRSASFRVAHQVIVVDNASTDGSVRELENDFPEVRLIRHGFNGGFGSACNLGAKHADGRAVLFLNPDTRAEDDFLSPMVEYLAGRDDVGVMGPQHRYPDNTFQLTAGALPNFGVEMRDKALYFCHRHRLGPVQQWLERRFASVRDVAWVAGACLLARRPVFEAAGGYDESFFLYFEDKDLCKKIGELGYRIVYFPRAHVTHLLGRSSHDVPADHLRRIYRESQRYYYRKHHGPIQGLLLKSYHAVSR